MAEASFGNTTIPRPATQPAAPSSQPPNRISFASADALPPKAGARLSAGVQASARPEWLRPRPVTETTPATPRLQRPPQTELERARFDFVMKLLALKPNRIIGNFDAIDLRERADYVRDVLAVVGNFVNAVAADTAYEAPCGTIDTDYVATMLRDTASDIVAHISRKAAAMEDAEREAESECRTVP